MHGGSLSCTKGGHMTHQVQQRMCGVPTWHTMRQTARCGALGRIAHRRSTPSGVVGFRQRHMGRPNCRFGLFGGFWGGAYTCRRHPNNKKAAVWGVWAHELPPRPHNKAHAHTQRLGTVGAWGVTCVHQGGAHDMSSATAHVWCTHPAHHAAHRTLRCSRAHCTPQINA